MESKIIKIYIWVSINGKGGKKSLMVDTWRITNLEIEARFVRITGQPLLHLIAAVFCIYN